MKIVYKFSQIIANKTNHVIERIYQERHGVTGKKLFLNAHIYSDSKSGRKAKVKGY
jgi:hypothetical protein